MKTTPHRSLIVCAQWLLPAALLLACRSVLLGATNDLRHQPKVIYGTDDRLDLYQETSPQRRAWAAAVCALVETPRLFTNASTGEIVLKTEALRFGQFVPCNDEPFRDQPVGAFCTAFLIASNLVATAGHCLKSECDLDGVRFVFGFQMLDSRTAKTNFSPAEVYRGVEVVRQFLSADLDYAVIRLDRAVTARDAAPLAVRTSGAPVPGTTVGVIGHPIGLPLKLAFGNATVVGQTNDQFYFTVNSDTYGGNSGSPVLNAQSGLVEGILVRGITDFQLRDGCVTSRRVSDSASLEEATRATVIPWAALINPAPPANDAFANRIRLSGTNLIARGSNLHATREAGEPLNAGNAGGKSVWWSWVAPASGFVVITTGGSDFGTSVGVFTGSPVNRLQLVKSSDNGGIGASSFLLLPVTQGTEYHIAVDGFCGAAGNIVLTLTADNRGSQFANSATLGIPRTGRATVYPSTITASGLVGVISRMKVTLLGYTHDAPWLVDALLVGPQGQKVMLMGQAGGNPDYPISNIVLTFDDAANRRMPQWLDVNPVLTSGSYQPTDYQSPDVSLPSPAPPRPYGNRLAVFGGTDPNGIWRLYLNVPFIGTTDGGQVNGWALDIETVPNTSPIISPIATVVVPSSPHLQPITFSIGDAETPAEQLTASVESSNPGWTPTNNLIVTGVGGQRSLFVIPASAASDTATLTVRVRDGAGASASSSFSYSALGVGRSGFASNQRGGIAVQGRATPYPSPITVSGLRRRITRMRTTLLGYTHDAPWLVDALLVGPQGQRVILMGQAGGNLDYPVTNLVMTFDDAASRMMPHWLDPNPILVSGSYQPTDYQSTNISLPVPAPPRPYAKRLSDFSGTNPNGVWSLFVNVPHFGTTAGGLFQGWALDIETEPLVLTQLTTAADRAAGLLRIGWTATIGERFQLQYIDDLRSANWSNDGSEIIATQSNLIRTIPLTEARRFYRLLQTQ